MLAIQSQSQNKVTLALVDKVIEAIDRDEGISELQVTISDALVDQGIEEQVGSESVTIMGIHTFFLVEMPVSKERLALEYTAICVLADISTKYLMKHPNITKEEKVSTEESLIVVISFESFKKYQTMCMGLRVFQNIHGVKPIRSSQIKVHSNRFGVISLPSSNDKDRLAYATQWTRDVFSSSKLTFSTINGTRYLDTSKVILPPNRFFVQTFEEGEEKFVFA
jgi:hypothetical protein